MHYVLTGTSFDGASGKMQDPYLRLVIYMPFATPQSTGPSTKASDNASWLIITWEGGCAHHDQSSKKQSACWVGEFSGGLNALSRFDFRASREPTRALRTHTRLSVNAARLIRPFSARSIVAAR